MTTKTWNGSTADWYTSNGGDWTPTGDPGASDAVVINSGEGELQRRRWDQRSVDLDHGRASRNSRSWGNPIGQRRRFGQRQRLAAARRGKIGGAGGSSLTIGGTLTNSSANDHCVDIADFAAANEGELSQIVDLPHGAPSHHSFSRLFRLLDPEEMTAAFARFHTALRAELGLPPAKGVIAVDGKSLRRGYQRGRAFMPPLMISVWDAETRLSLASRHAPGGDEVAATLAALKAGSSLAAPGAPA